MHPKRFFSDDNFPTFLRALEKALIYIAENDPHYRGWLAIFLLVTRDVMNWQYDNFNHKRYYYKNRKRFDKSVLKHPNAKFILFFHYIAQHAFEVIPKTKTVRK